MDLPAGGAATFLLTGMVAVNPATATLTSTARIAAPSGTSDPAAANNTARDTDYISLALTLPLRDSFDRADADGLGSKWSPAAGTSIRIRGNQAFANAAGGAIWTSAFGRRQGASLTFAAAPVDGTSLVLKATSGSGSASNPGRFIRVQYLAGQLVVATTTNGQTASPTYSVHATLPAMFVAGEALTALAYADGTVTLYRTTATGLTTFLGGVSVPVSGPQSWAYGSGAGRVGMQLPQGATVDNFRAGDIR